ncbi:hypothetical protein [Paenibacillus pini]|uniref:Uncharacterized protein n=1 Tax=Paenibacillus pini JCM 16418 TaxID=1236976 RepID=W7YBH7_9BACL|nr:hypothetical protein [Paenibacillus pini]GAF08190.1 hypothetical protein JCM16418_2231 [Paenibacillus pini JCM 16418]
MIMSAKGREPVPESLTCIHRIELYILHLNPSQPNSYRVYEDHYHVLMYMKTNNGSTWSEVFLNEANRPADWVYWASWYEKFLHRKYVGEAELQADVLASMTLPHLPKAQLIYDALHLIKDRKTSFGPPEEVSKIVHEAEAYVCLF